MASPATRMAPRWPSSTPPWPTPARTSPTSRARSRQPAYPSMRRSTFCPTHCRSGRPWRTPRAPSVSTWHPWTRPCPPGWPMAPGRISPGNLPCCPSPPVCPRKPTMRWPYCHCRAVGSSPRTHRGSPSAPNGPTTFPTPAPSWSASCTSSRRRRVPTGHRARSSSTCCWTTAPSQRSLSQRPTSASSAIPTVTRSARRARARSRSTRMVPSMPRGCPSTPLAAMPQGASWWTT